MYSICKEFTFESAHRLVHGYEGNCAHLHGHGFVAKVFLRSKTLTGHGMVRDFSDVKILRTWVDENLDHATLVSKVDEPLIQFLKSHQQRYFIIPSFGQNMHPNPTSENIAQLIYNKAHDLGLKETYAIEINETCTSAARYEP